MRRTIIYSVSHAEGVSYVTTKAEALRLAADESDDPFVGVQRHRVTAGLGTRELACALLNGSGWAAETEDVL